MAGPLVVDVPRPPSDALPGAPSARVRLRLGGLLMFSLAGFLLHWTVGLFTFVWFLGPFFAYAFHLTRPPFPHRDNVLLTRIVVGLLFGFVPVLLIVALVTTSGVDLPMPSRLPFDMLLMVVAYVSSLAGIVLAAYHVIHRRGTARERAFFRRLRWPLAALAAWSVVFLVLELRFNKLHMSVDYLGVAGFGLYPGAAILIAWLCIAGYRAFRPVLGVPRGRPSPAAVTPTFSSFRG